MGNKPKDKSPQANTTKFTVRVKNTLIEIKGQDTAQPFGSSDESTP